MINSTFISAVSLPPSQPDVTDYNERSMTLKWKAPIDDGGMKITAYNIEAKTQGLTQFKEIWKFFLPVYLECIQVETGRSGSVWTPQWPRWPCRSWLRARSISSGWSPSTRQGGQTLVWPQDQRWPRRLIVSIRISYISVKVVLIIL